MKARVIDAALFALSASGIAYLARRISRGSLGELDARVAAACGIRERNAERISQFAEPGVIAVGTIALALVPRLRPRERAFIVLAPLLATIVGEGLKKLVPRERPNKTRFETTGGESFPSTHTAHAMALSLACTELARRRQRGKWVYAIAAGVVGSIGVARVRGAAHWPSDVLAGALLGLGAVRAAHLAVL